MSNPKPSAIVVVVDRLGAAWLGPYGNTWIDTPWINQFACESFLCEQAIIDSPDLSRVYESYWTGHHACLAPQPDRSSSLLRHLAEKNVDTALVTDEPILAEHSYSAGMRSTVLETIDSGASAESVDETHLARLLAVASDVLGSLDPPYLLWIHARGMAGSWDAPLVMRNAFVEEDDPAPADFTEPPSCRLPEDYDPDELLGMVHAYAGQVSLVDECVGAFLATVADGNVHSGLTIFTSSRGFPLGEHLSVGAYDDALYSELLQVPLMLCPPNRGTAMQRSQQLVQPPDIYATLARWFGIQTASGQDLTVMAHGGAHRSGYRAMACVGNDRALRTPAWFARRPFANPGVDDPLRVRDKRENLELYVKPDDRFEVNNVAVRCPEVVEALADAWNDFEQSLASPQHFSSVGFEEILMRGME